MKGIIRALLAAVGVLGILGVAAVVYVTTFFDPNDLKPRLIAAVRDQSGLELQLDGPLSWTFYPRIGVSVADAEAWLPEQAHDDEAFVGFGRAEISVAFAPLLRGDVAIDGLILEGMRLNLVRDEQGRGNWQALLDQLGAEEGVEESGDEAQNVGSPESVTSGPGLSQNDSQAVAFDIANVQVSDSRVHYIDRQRPLDMTLDDLALASRNVSPRAAFPIDLSFNASGSEPVFDGQAQLKSRMRMDLSAGRYTFEGVTFNASGQFPGIAEQAQNLVIKIATLTADTQARQYRADRVEANASLYHPQLAQAPLSLQLFFNASTDLQAQTAALNDVSLTGDDGLDLSGNLRASQLGESPSYQGQMELAPLSLRDWLTRLGMDVDTADSDALTELAISGPFSGDRERVEFSDLRLQLDDTQLRGTLGAGFEGQTLAFDLAGNALDLDRYLSDPQASDEAPDSGGDSQQDTAWLRTLGIAPAFAATDNMPLLPVAWLSVLSQEGHLKLDDLTLKGVRLSDVALTTSGSDGRQRLEGLSAQLYGGTLDASSSLDLRQTPITATFTPRLAGIDIAPFYRDLSGRESPLRGSLNLQGDFESRTNTREGLKQNLNGQAAIRIDDGAMLDVNVSQQLCSAVAALENRESTREWRDDTPFERLRASVVVENGVARSDDLDIAIPGIAMSGQGEVNLVTERFDSRAAARWQASPDEAACAINPRLARIDFPVRCQGTLSDPSAQWCAFDRDAFGDSLASLARDAAGQRLGEALDEQVDDDVRRQIDERLGEGATDDIGDRLRGLFD